MPEFGDHLIFTLASKTGWPDEYLRFEIPLQRLLRLYHCALYAEGAWTVPFTRSKPEQFSKLEEFARSINHDDE